MRSSTILLAEGTEHIPFDIRTLRAIVYEYTPPGMRKMQQMLKEAVLSILAHRDKIDNPVRRYLYQREKARLISEKVPPGFDAIRNLVVVPAGIIGGVLWQQAPTLPLDAAFVVGSIGMVAFVLTGLRE